MGFWSGARRHAGFLTLFTVLTSTSLNTMTFARIRRDDRNLHKLQCAVLHQLCTTLHNMPSSSKITLEEQRRIVKRVRALRIDPLKLGISTAAMPSDEVQARARQTMESQTSWGKALFGVGTLSRARHAMSRAFDNVTGRVPSDTLDVMAAHADESDEDLLAWLESLGDDTKDHSDGHSETSNSRNVAANALRQEDQISMETSHRQFSWFSNRLESRAEFDAHNLLSDDNEKVKETQKVHIVF